MGFEELGSLIWRRKLVFGLTLLLALGAVVAGTLLLPKSYEASATLLAGPPPGESSTPLDTTQGEQLARTYSTLASNPAVAAEVAEGMGLDRDQLLAKMSFAPVERTQLVQVTAESESASEAAEIANAYATTFTERVAERAAGEEGAVNLEVIEPAVIPDDPAKPNVPLYIGFGAVLALLLAMGAALLRDRLDRRLRVSPNQNELLGTPIIGRIPRGSAGPVTGLEEIPIEVADQIRVLRTNVELLGARGVKTLVITSPGVGEGKSTVAAHFASTIAGDGDRVALVEGDLRRPSLDLGALAPGLERGRLGLGRYLAGQASRNEVVRRDESFPNLSVVYAGSSSEEPARLLRSVQLPKLLDQLAANHDWVIVDAPPVLISDDALVLLSQADAALFVVDSRKTPLPAARAALGQLAKLKTRVAGIAVNGTPKPKRDSYYYAAGMKARINRDSRSEEPAAEETAVGS